MIVNRQSLLAAAPIDNMTDEKHRANGVSWGLTEAGYDIRILQTVQFSRRMITHRSSDERYYGMTHRIDGGPWLVGSLVLASTMEHFTMPTDLVGVVHDKSTWARCGLSVLNTVLEPGWTGGLTMELVYHGEDDLILHSGCGIAQVLFSRIEDPAQYSGKYQNQDSKPVSAIFQ